MRLRAAAIGLLAAFGLNWAWENAQAPLYKGYAGFANDVWMCTVATFGDVVIVAAIWAAVALAWRDPGWHRRPGAAQYGAAAFVGAGFALGIEYWALATNRWIYDGMPLVPYTRAGLTPIVQMLAIPPLAFALMRRCDRGRKSAVGTAATGQR